MLKHDKTTPFNYVAVKVNRPTEKKKRCSNKKDEFGVSNLKHPQRWSTPPRFG